MDSTEKDPNYNWVICPFVENWEITRMALKDLIAQGVEGFPIRILAIDQGRRCFEELQEFAANEGAGYIETWHPDPPLISLAALWNTALNYVWSYRAEWCLVVNNDARFRPDMYRLLRSVPSTGFVSAYGLHDLDLTMTNTPDLEQKGGPDFSCFLIYKALHDAFKFDERFVPAYCEDVDYHRTLMLAGEGQRIFSVGVPFYHPGSGTLKSLDEKRRLMLETAITKGSRAHFAKKWGGPVNQERFAAPFSEVAVEGMTTPELFERERAKWQR